MNASDQELVTREPAVAGQFYPGNPSELKSELDSLFKKLEPKSPGDNVLALIAPHAGYVYSGYIAAESFVQIDPKKEYDNIFLIGSSHRLMFDGASIYTSGNFKTPLGIVPVNIALAKELTSNCAVFTTQNDAHSQEHSLEVQLPFLQYHLKKPFRIVPIIIATQQAATCRKIAEALKPYFNSSNLFIISTDFSHYPAYSAAKKVDLATAKAIQQNNPEMLLHTLKKNEQEGVEGLLTSLCGWTSVLTLQYITADMPGITYELIDYRNSGDKRYYSDKSRVVGYCSLAVRQEKKPPDELQEDVFELHAEDQEALTRIAHETLESYIHRGIIPDIDPKKLSHRLLISTGAFVSLYINEKLRGCIGKFKSDEPLYKVVQEMTVSSATHDYRFSRVERKETPEVRIEISVLTPLKRIESIDEIQLGRHGIYIKKGSSSGTYLPQVASSTGWTVEEFVSHCSRDKAGLGPEGWRNAELYTYEAIIIKE